MSWAKALSRQFPSGRQFRNNREQGSVNPGPEWLARPDLSRARCSVDFDWVPRNVRNLVLNENLQNKRSHFVLKSIAQSLNSCAVDDVLKLAADASVGAVNLLSDPGSYRFGSLDIRVEPLDYDCLGRCRQNLMAASTSCCDCVAILSP